jgi:hypothetical protein
MANQKIPSSITTDILESIRATLRRPARQFEAQFPLDADDVQLLVLDPDMIGHCNALRARDISGIQMTGSIVIRLSADHVPEGWKPLPRDVVLFVNNVKMFFPKYTSRTSPPAGNNIARLNKSDYVDALIHNITEEKWNQLLSWLAPIVHARRREHLASWFTESVMYNLTDTTTLHMLWPQLATFVTEEKWKHRINEVSNRTAPYAPRVETVELVRKYRAAAEEILADCSLTPETNGHHRRQFAQVLAWQFLDGEWKPA